MGLLNLYNNVLTLHPPQQPPLCIYHSSTAPQWLFVQLKMKKKKYFDHAIFIGEKSLIF